MSTPTPWKIVPVTNESNLYLLKDGKNRNITNDMFAYKSEWWEYFDHAVNAVNFVERLSKCKLSEELDDEQLGNADFKDGYDQIIRDARRICRCSGSNHNENLEMRDLPKRLPLFRNCPS